MGLDHRLRDSGRHRTPGRCVPDVLRAAPAEGPLRVAVIGSARFGAGEPFAGGLEAHTHTTAVALQAAGHRVTVFAGPASAGFPPGLNVVPIVARQPDFSTCQRSDTSVPPGVARELDRGYRDVLAQVTEPGRFDVVHNNSLHYLPPLLDSALGVPMVHVLHCPPFADLELAHRHRRHHDARPRGAVVAVSQSVARQWEALADVIVPNGVDTDAWRPLDLAITDRCVWAGRCVPEKAPHLAIDAARAAGREITLVGPVQHPEYFRTEVQPRLGADAVWAGHVDRAELRALFSSSGVGVVTPQWDEPFGLVIAEMLACGLPVAAFERGAVASVIEAGVGVLAGPGAVDELATAINSAAGLDRAVCRKYAMGRLSAVAMIDRYIRLYRRAMAPGER